MFLGAVGEGHMSLLNTDYGKRTCHHMARFLTMAKDYARSQGFKGTFSSRPKPIGAYENINTTLILQIAIDFKRIWFRK